MTEANPAEIPKPLGWTVRRHRPGDLERLAELSARSFASPWSREKLAAEAALRGGALWVAEGPADPAPLAYLAARQAADELEVTSLAVDPAWRRAGVASALLRHALDEARAHGVRWVHLEVRLGNTGARAFYAARGFSVRGRRARYYAPPVPGGAREDALRLSRRLDAAAGKS